jgi:hypothetical protein
MLFRFALACVLALPLSAQSWDMLQSLRPGETIKVLDIKGQEDKGAFRAVTDSAITLTAGKSEKSIERARVRRVQVSSKAHRGRNAAIGAGIGIAVAVLVDQTVGAYLRNETGDSGRAITYIAPIGLFGAIGAALPGYRTVYRAR